MIALVIGGSSLAERRIVPAFHRLGVELDVASRTAAWPAARSGPGATFSDYGQALDRSRASLVYVSTRNHEHVEWARAALDSGRHVVIDKPAALMAGEVFELAALAERRGLLLAEATVYPWHPQCAALGALVETHGPLTRLVATFTFPPLASGNFRHRAGCGGGALRDLGPYAVTPGRLLFDADPIEMVVRTSTPPGSEVETAFSVILRYPGDRELVGHYGSTTAYVNRLDALGPALAVTLDRAFTTPDHVACRLHGQAGGAPVELATGPADAFALFLEAVLAGIATGDHVRFRETICRDARLLDQLRASSRS